MNWGNLCAFAKSNVVSFSFSQESYDHGKIGWCLILIHSILSADFVMRKKSRPSQIFSFNKMVLLPPKVTTMQNQRKEELTWCAKALVP